MVYPLTAPHEQSWAGRNQYLLTASGSLEDHLRAFLVCCKVNEFTSATIQYYRYQVGRFVDFCGDIDPEEVDANLVREFLLHLRESNSPRSVHAYFRAVRRFFNWLVEEGRLSKSPMTKMKPPKFEQRIIQPFTSGHISLMLEVCDPDTFLGLRNRAIILTFLDTGLRLSEMASLHIADVDFGRGTIKVLGKGAKERVVATCKKTQKALLSYLLSRSDKHTELWVTEERRPISADGIKQMIEVIGKRASITDVRCSAHTFRHTFATHALINGAGEFNVQRLLGHNDLRMTRRYSDSLRSEQAVEAHKKFSPVDNMKL